MELLITFIFFGFIKPKVGSSGNVSGVGAGLGGGAEEELSVGSHRRGYKPGAAELEGEMGRVTLGIAAEGVGAMAKGEDPSALSPPPGSPLFFFSF